MDDFERAVEGYIGAGIDELRNAPLKRGSNFRYYGLRCGDEIALNVVSHEYCENAFQEAVKEL